MMTTATAQAGTLTVKTTPQGMKVIHKQTHSNEIVAIDLFLKVGSAWEQPGQEGLANFTHSLLTKGTKTKNAEKIAELIEGVGGSLSGSLGEDSSELYAVLTKDQSSLGFDLLRDCVSHPTFPEEEMKKDRQAILAGIRSRKDRIFTVAYDLLHENIYGKSHPYGRIISGRQETVKRFKRKDLESWHATHYTPNRMVLVVVGDIPFEKVWEEAQKPWGSKASKSKAEAIYPALPLHDKAVWVSETRPFEQAYVMMGFPAPSAYEKDYAALKVLNAILGGGMSSRLFQKLREEQGLAYETDSFYPSHARESVFVVYIGLDKANVEKTSAQMQEILMALQENGVSPDEVKDAKSFLRGQYLLDHQTNKKQAWYLGWWELLGKGYSYDQRYLEDLSKVTPEQIRSAAQKYFSQPAVGVKILP